MSWLPYSAVGNVQSMRGDGQLILQLGNHLLLLYDGLLQWRDSDQGLLQAPLDDTAARLPLYASRYGTALERIVISRRLLQVNSDEVRARQARRRAMSRWC